MLKVRESVSMSDNHAVEGTVIPEDGIATSDDDIVKGSVILVDNIAVSSEDVEEGIAYPEVEIDNTVNRIVILRFPNLVFRRFVLNGIISRESVSSWPASSAEKQLRESDYLDSTKNTGLAFHGIKCILNISLGKFEVGLEIGDAFEWKHIVPQVINVIESVVQREEAEVEVRYAG